MRAVFLDKNTFTVDLPSPKTLSDFTMYDRTDQNADLIVERCKDAQIVVTNKVRIDADILDRLPKLKLIQIAATGTDNVDQNACKARSIAVKNVRDYAAFSVCEHAFMLMLNAARAGVHYHACAKNGAWQQDGRFCLVDTPLLDLAGRTLGVIGAGAIGSRFGQLASAFGMRVLYAERPGKAPRNANYTAFERTLAQADVLSLHCPLNDETRHLINKDAIALMKKKPILVNVARGAVVDAEAILWALKNDKIGGYASDVFAQEPPAKDDPLLSFCHPRLIFSPHNAWASQDAQTRLWQGVCQNIDAFVVGGA